MAAPAGGQPVEPMAAAVPDMPELPDDMAPDAIPVDMIMEIVVTGSRTRPRFTTPVSGSGLSGDALAASVRATLGDTLAKLPGISSNSFGPGASRPVIRGFQGERTRLLIDGIGSLDVSNTSPDHAVAINPLVAERIEVLRGASALLYASGAVGGVVNTIGGRLPRRVPADEITGVAALGFGSAANEVAAGSSVNLALGDNFVVHVDGHYLDADDVAIGGFVLAPEERRQAAASPDAGIRRLAALRGRLPNSDARTFELAAGGSFIADGGILGLSLSWFESAYGLPTRFSLDPATPQPDSRIDLGQFRVDALAEVYPGGDIVDTLRFRFGYADYAHDELIDTDVVTATFRNEAFEARSEIGFADIGRLRALVGGQLQFRDFRVIAAAPLLPPTDTAQIAGFAHFELDLAPLRLESGLRYEHVIVRAAADAALRNDAALLSYDVFSASLGGNYRVSSQFSLGVNAQYGERAPVVEELFTQGTDPGTQGVLLGNPRLGKERSYGVEAVARAFTATASIEASVYYYRFAGFIFAGETGAAVGGLPVFQFQSADARFAGFEVAAKADVARAGDWIFGVDGLADYTSAALLGGGGPVPRIPPLRLLFGASARSGAHDARLEVEWVAPQDRVSAFETPTRGFTLVNVLVTTRPFGADSPLALTLSANNLLAAEARRHASFLKDFAPIAGRDLRIGARLRF